MERRLEVMNQGVEVNREAVKSLAAKLDSFAVALSEEERRLLGAVLGAGASTLGVSGGQEVEGYVLKVGAGTLSFGSPASSSVGGSLFGLLGQAPGVAIPTVSEVSAPKLEID
jgi:hypothetical protein